MDRQLFIPLLKELGFPPEKYDMILNYIENHLRNEIQSSMTVADRMNDFVTTLPMALRALSKLDLDNVTIVDTPTNTETFSDSFIYDRDSFMFVKDIEAELSVKFVDNIVEVLKKKMENSRINIYVLFSHIQHVPSDNRFFILHRFKLV